MSIDSREVSSFPKEGKLEIIFFLEHKTERNNTSRLRFYCPNGTPSVLGMAEYLTTYLNELSSTEKDRNIYFKFPSYLSRWFGANRVLANVFEKHMFFNSSGLSYFIEIKQVLDAESPEIYITDPSDNLRGERVE